MNSHLMFWNVYPETTQAEIDRQTADFYAMGQIPEVLGLTLARGIPSTPDKPNGGRIQSNPFQPRSLANFERIRPGYDWWFGIQFEDPAVDAEARYNPHPAHLEFAWKNCRTIWRDYFHHDWLTETIETGKALPEKRIYHFDYWALWPDVDPEAVERMYGALMTMPERVPDLLRIRVGRQDPARVRGNVSIGNRDELGLRHKANWHFTTVDSLFDGYFQMEFTDLDAFQRYMDSDARIGFAGEFCGPLWREFFTQRFERVPNPHA